MSEPIEVLHARIAALCEENRALRESIESMQDALTGEFDAWLVGNFTHSEAILLGFLARRGRASKAQMHQFLYGVDPEGGAEPKIIDVMVCKIRKKLPPGAEIRTLWGVGYEISPASVEILKGRAA